MEPEYVRNDLNLLGCEGVSAGMLSLFLGRFLIPDSDGIFALPCG